MGNLKKEIRRILNNPPTKKVKCNCGGKEVYKYTEPDGPNASDFGNIIYGQCDKCDRNDMVLVEDTNKMIKLIIDVCKSE